MAKKALDVKVPHFEPPTAEELQALGEVQTAAAEADRMTDDGNPYSPPPKVLAIGEKTVELILPQQELIEGGYIPCHVDLVMDKRQGQVVAQLRDGLKAGHVQLSTGRHVETNADTLRWLLDALADELGIAW